MAFDEAVNRVLFQYATFGGRAPRAEFWWWMVFLLATSAGVAFVATMMGFTRVFVEVLWLALLLPSAALCVRRVHDVGKPGWFALVPGYNLYLAVLPGDAAANAYGAPWTPGR
ncbi:MAG: DUF805 domain-containing protein [Chloroflexota bacterium]